MKVKPRNAKVSGLLTSRFLRLTAAWRDHAAGWRDEQAKTGLTATPFGEELRVVGHC